MLYVSKAGHVPAFLCQRIRILFNYIIFIGWSMSFTECVYQGSAVLIPSDMIAGFHRVVVGTVSHGERERIVTEVLVIPKQAANCCYPDVLVTRTPLYTLMKQYPHMVQIHRRTIVDVDHIEAVCITGVGWYRVRLKGVVTQYLFHYASRRQYYSAIRKSVPSLRPTQCV